MIMWSHGARPSAEETDCEVDFATSEALRDVARLIAGRSTGGATGAEIVAMARAAAAMHLAEAAGRMAREGRGADGEGLR